MSPTSAVAPQPVLTGTSTSKITGMQNMSRIVKMLLAREGLSPRQFIAVSGVFRNAQSLYDRLNAKKDWEANELRLMAEFFNVPVSAFFEDPDALLGPRGRGQADSPTAWNANTGKVVKFPSRLPQAA